MMSRNAQRSNRIACAGWNELQHHPTRLLLLLSSKKDRRRKVVRAAIILQTNIDGLIEPRRKKSRKPSPVIKASRKYGRRVVFCLCCVAPPHLHSALKYDEVFDRSIATICITRRLLRRVLLSSNSANIPKVVLLIAMTDQVRASHYLKAHLLDKSQSKSRPSVRRSPMRPSHLH